MIKRPEAKEQGVKSESKFKLFNHLVTRKRNRKGEILMEEFVGWMDGRRMF